MTMEESRRSRLGTQPLPLTWEVPATIGLLTLLLVLLTPLAVQAAVALVTAGGPAWPNPTLTGLVGMAHGTFGHGLPTGVAEQLPPNAVMWTLTAAAEVTVLGSLGVLGGWARKIAGNGAGRGLASPAVAAQALGIGHLRREATVIRPDLVSGRRGRRGRRGNR